jgi:hypothetical protein
MSLRYVEQFQDHQQLTINYWLLRRALLPSFGDLGKPHMNNSQRKEKSTISKIGIIENLDDAYYRHF